MKITGSSNIPMAWKAPLQKVRESETENFKSMKRTPSAIGKNISTRYSVFSKGLSDASEQIIAPSDSKTVGTNSQRMQRDLYSRYIFTNGINPTKPGYPSFSKRYFAGKRRQTQTFVLSSWRLRCCNWRRQILLLLKYATFGQKS